MTSEAYYFGTVAVAPFPFSDIAHAKPRPVVVLASAMQLGAYPPQCLCAMITSTKQTWDSDTTILDLSQAGLKVPCRIRLKLFTLDARLLLRVVGQLSSRDQQALRSALKSLWA